jgi:hypothetical protein
MKYNDQIRKWMNFFEKNAGEKKSVELKDKECYELSLLFNNMLSISYASHELPIVEAKYRKIRNLFNEFIKHIEWHRTRSLLPYDWEEYEEGSYHELKRLLESKEKK